MAGIITVQSVFAAESVVNSSDSDWHVGKNLDEKDYFHYELCHKTYKNCQLLDMHIWTKPRYNTTEMWSFEVLVVDDNQKIRGEIIMDKNNTSSSTVSQRIIQFGKMFGQFISDSNYYVKDLRDRGDLVSSTVNNTKVYLFNTNSIDKSGTILISDQLPFPSRGNETYKETVYSNQGIPGEKIFEIELVSAKKNHTPDFLMYDSRIDKNSILEHSTRVLMLPEDANTIQLPKPLTALVKGIWIYLSPGATDAILEFNAETSSYSGGWHMPVSSGGEPITITFEDKLPVSDVRLTYDNACCDTYVHIGYHYTDLDGESHELPEAYLDPIIDSLRPLHQIKAGVQPTDVFCKPEMSLIFKMDSTPACVKEHTAKSLIVREWGFGFYPIR